MVIIIDLPQLNQISEIMTKEFLQIIPYEPLFEHTTGRQNKTI